MSVQGMLHSRYQELPQSFPLSSTICLDRSTFSIIKFTFINKSFFSECVYLFPNSPETTNSNKLEAGILSDDFLWGPDGFRLKNIRIWPIVRQKT